MSQPYLASSGSSDDEESGGHAATDRTQRIVYASAAAPPACKPPQDDQHTGRERAYGNPDMEARGLPLRAVLLPPGAGRHLVSTGAAEASGAEVRMLLQESTAIEQRILPSKGSPLLPYSISPAAPRQGMGKMDEVGAEYQVSGHGLLRHSLCDLLHLSQQCHRWNTEKGHFLMADWRRTIVKF